MTAVRRVQAGTTNLPADISSFVGRRQDLVSVKNLLAASRLVTLTGSGGVGKTRLATKVGSGVRRAFKDGVWLVELDKLVDPALLPHTVAGALGLRQLSPDWSVDALLDFLSLRQALLLLDNCEHLVDGCATMTESLLRGCPGLRVLATSREPLSITGEAVYVVPPMEVPSSDDAMSESGLNRFDAVRLFVDRARAMVVGFELTEENSAAVAAICQRLDGLPLALELAAARLRALTPEQILDHLGDRLRLLSPRTRGALLRQHTLRSSIEWSYGLCSPQERGLWSRLSVFSGGFELDAVEGVCADEELSAGSILDLVSALVDKSVVLREERGPVVRYRMLESIREFGYEKLSDEDAARTFAVRHRDWFAGMVFRARNEWIGPRQADWLNRLNREHPNIRSALDRFLTDTDDPHRALDMAADLKDVWITGGLFSEGRLWLDRALVVSGEPSSSRARALQVNAWLAILQGDDTSARQLLEETRQIAEGRHDRVLQAHASQAMGLRALFVGDATMAVESFQKALATFSGGVDPAGEVESWSLLALTHSISGDADQAAYCHQRCLALTGPVGETWFRSYSLWGLGLAAWREGDTSQAEAHERESLQLKRSVDDDLGIAVCLEALACVAATEGQFDRAATLMGVAAGLWERMGTDTGVFRDLDLYHQGCVRSCRHALGDREFEDRYSVGSSFDRASALAFALREGKPSAMATQRPTGPLTKREQEVAQLVADALSNKEIAQLLVISQRTVEAHVEHILTKLGFSSRLQVATWVAEQRTQGSGAAPGRP